MRGPRGTSGADAGALSTARGEAAGAGAALAKRRLRASGNAEASVLVCTSLQTAAEGPTGMGLAQLGQYDSGAQRARRARSPASTAGHTPSTMENTTVSR